MFLFDVAVNCQSIYSLPIYVYSDLNFLRALQGEYYSPDLIKVDLQFRVGWLVKDALLICGKAGLWPRLACLHAHTPCTAPIPSFLWVQWVGQGLDWTRKGPT